MEKNILGSEIEYDKFKFSKEFRPLERIDKGNYGTVFKVEERRTNKLYAIKKIFLTGPEAMVSISREIEINMKIKSNLIVECFDVWKDDDIVYVQMELCQTNLRKILDDKAMVFGRAKHEKMNNLEFFLSCQLLKDLSECLNYLHTNSPIIMHRDLKPANVLICINDLGNFIKLGDFGLSKEYIKSSNTRHQGTGKYVAWENRNSKGYNYLADVFSLAVIGLEILAVPYNEKKNLDCVEFLKLYEGTKLVDKFKNLLEFLLNCVARETETNYKSRPNCSEFLAKINEIIAYKIDVLKDNEFKNYFRQIEQSQNEFFIKYAKFKLNLN